MKALRENMQESSVTSRLVDLIMKMSDEERERLLRELEEKLSLIKRKYDRKPYFSIVDYDAKEGSYTDFIQNISAGGVFIGTSKAFSVGQEFVLAFPLPISQEHARITGEVVWVGEEGIGVKFKKIDYEQEATIKGLLDMMR
jgi:uncharacterized protein (TIGR02266 family)